MPLVTFGAAAAATAGGVVQDVTSSAILYAASNRWKENKSLSLEKLKKRARIAAKQKATFGFPKDLDRTWFCMSPITKKLHDEQLEGGRVHVAYVRPGLGKTSACQILLRCTGRYQYGIAFCPPAQSEKSSFLVSMRDYLGLHEESAPEGWLDCFFSALSDLGAPVVVLLDDFMSGGISVLESDLCFAIKSLVRNTNITVIVLTQNRDAADHLLTKNGWVGIIPVLNNKAILNIRAKPPAQRVMNWNRDFDMSWQEDQLFSAARSFIESKGVGQTESETRSKISAYLGNLSQTERDEVTPLDIIDVVKKEDSVPAQSTVLPDNARWEKEQLPDLEIKSFCGAEADMCSSCAIL